MGRWTNAGEWLEERGWFEECLSTNGSAKDGFANVFSMEDSGGQLGWGV
jgi:hypothetical protein